MSTRAIEAHVEAVRKELEIEAALRQLVDAVRRLAPDYCQAHGLPQTTDDELDCALERAEDVLDVLDELQ